MAAPQRWSEISADLVQEGQGPGPALGAGRIRRVVYGWERLTGYHIGFMPSMRRLTLASI